MMLRVIADLKSHVVEFTDLFPSRVVLLILKKSQSLRDVKRRTETRLLQNARNKMPVGFIRVVEAEHNELVGDWQQLGFLSSETIVC